MRAGAGRLGDGRIKRRPARGEDVRAVGPQLVVGLGWVYRGNYDGLATTRPFGQHTAVGGDNLQFACALQHLRRQLDVLRNGRRKRFGHQPAYFVGGDDEAFVFSSARGNVQ